MTCKQALADLIAKVEAGGLPRETIAIAAFDVQPILTNWRGVVADAYNGSLDAAKLLHEAVLPRYYAQVYMCTAPEMCRVDIGGGHTGRGDNPARAWLLAILRALHSMEPRA